MLELRSSSSAAVFFAAVGVVAAVSAGVRAQKGIQRLAADYVAEYQRQLTAIVADEEYVQEIRSQVPAVPEAPRSRSTTGEVFFIFTAPAHGWMAIRDVQTVDGAATRERTDVREILRSLPAAQVGEQMRSYNARFNIGRIARNINEPTLALLPLDEVHRSRFRFTTRKRTDVDGRALIWLGFQERESPTLIRGVDGSRIFVKGELLVEMANGRIWETRLSAAVGTINVELTTEYRFDQRLGMMLPVVFRELYEQGTAPTHSRVPEPGTAVLYEQIACEAKYSNFRRFEVLSRIR
jgi:hypothetical protein